MDEGEAILVCCAQAIWSSEAGVSATEIDEGESTTHEQFDCRFERETLLHSQAAFRKTDDGVEVRRQDYKDARIEPNDLHPKSQAQNQPASFDRNLRQSRLRAPNSR